MQVRSLDIDWDGISVVILQCHFMFGIWAKQQTSQTYWQGFQFYTFVIDEICVIWFWAVTCWILEVSSVTCSCHICNTNHFTIQHCVHLWWQTMWLLWVDMYAAILRNMFWICKSKVTLLRNVGINLEKKYYYYYFLMYSYLKQYIEYPPLCFTQLIQVQ